MTSLAEASVASATLKAPTDCDPDERDVTHAAGSPPQPPQRLDIGHSAHPGSGNMPPKRRSALRQGSRDGRGLGVVQDGCDVHVHVRIPLPQIGAQRGCV